MKLLFTETNVVQKICGRQEYIQNTPYRKSIHCFQIPCNEGVLLYHTMTGALILIQDGEEFEEHLETLVGHWFFVPEEFDEVKYTEDVRKIVRMVNVAPQGKRHFTVLTTTDCNARCFYCYEMGIPRYHMTDETARDVADYITETSGGENVKLSWFGGEPLYNYRAIEIICDRLKSNGIKYSSIMTSNGYYLGAEIAAKAKLDWNVQEIQITLDGTERTYNRTKAYIDADRNPFHRVLNNIESVLEKGIKVIIRLNVDADNANDIYQLIDDLLLRFPCCDKLSFNVVLLKQLSGRIHHFESEEQASAIRRRLIQKLDIHELVRYDEMSRNISINQCMADNDSCEVILPDGRIEKCEHYNEAEIIGSIYDNERDMEIVNAWKERIVFEECKKCVLYPRCYALRKCDWRQNGCGKTVQDFLGDMLRGQILKKYNEIKQGGVTSETEEQLYTDGTW